MEPELNTNTPAPGAQDAAIVSALQSSMLDNADLVSSGDSGVESAINGAISNIRGSQQASANRIENQAADQSRNIQRSGLIAQTDAVEGRRGFATQTAVLRNIMNTTNQELKDLDTRKQDLLLQGESEAASQISSLQIRSLELAQTAKQNAVNNMIGLTNSMFNFRRLEMDQDQQQKDNAFNTIASLRDIGTLQNSDPETLRNLEKDAGLPDGTLSNIPEVPGEFEIRQVGNSLLAIDPTDPTNLKVVYTAPATATGSGSSSNTLSIKETQDLGLPMSLVGLTEEEVVTSLAENSAPRWFREAEDASELMSHTPKALDEKWQGFRAGLLKRTSVPDEESSSGLVGDLVRLKNAGAL